MAYFAELNGENKVLRVIVVSDQEILDADGNEQESLGVTFCEQLFGGTWKQTSYNGDMRKNFAGIGYSFDSGRDAFIPPKPYNSWVLNETTCTWDAPVEMPTDGRYDWNESNQTWDLRE